MNLLLAIWTLGIDVAKAKLDCALRTPEGKYKNKVVSNNRDGWEQLWLWLAKQKVGKLHVCMEATNVYWEGCAEFLADQGLELSVVNPAQIKAFGVSRGLRTKDDVVDARLIAEFAYRMQPRTWQAPSPQERTLRALVLRLDALQDMHTQESNRLQVCRASVHDGIGRHLQWLQSEIAALSKAIRELIEDDPDLRAKAKLLASVPGLGERTIAVLLSFYAYPERFGNARQVAKFAGLNPREKRSGTLRGQTRLSKIGHSLVRKIMYMPAMSALYRTAWGKAFRDRLFANRKAPKLVIGAMMRKLVHVAFGVLKSGKPFNPALHGC